MATTRQPDLWLVPQELTIPSVDLHILEAGDYLRTAFRFAAVQYDATPLFFITCRIAFNNAIIAMLRTGHGIV